MKKILLSVCLAVMAFAEAGAAMTVGSEYYIWLNIYEKLLGSNKAGNGPALSAYGKNSDGYVFVAESSGKSGYVLLRQKSSGKYLAASSANGWSMTFESKSTDDRFCWKVEGKDCYAYLVNKKNSKYVGIDGAQKGNDYVSVYYDKPKGSHSQFSVIPAVGSTWADARHAYVSATYTNAQGVSEVDYCQLSGENLDYSKAVDIHITSNDKPMTSSTVNLGSDRTWLVFDNIVPSDVISNYLKYVTIKGAAAVNGSNCRVAIYLNGAVVIPTPEVVMACKGAAGNFSLGVGNFSDMKDNDNVMTSFTLRRGYMATLAAGKNGSGYSRVYVADHKDLVITLPMALSRRVSSVYIKPWQYLSKKGWGDTGGATKGPQLRASWFWSWGAAYSSTDDMEYVPCRQHRWWPSVSDVNRLASSATLSINEPEHSEQHDKSDCDCSDAWLNCTLMPDYLPSGARIGAPQPTDFSWMNTFFGHVDDMAYRCDFAVTHAYWNRGGRNETDYANWLCDTQCKSIWNNTKRPVWLTEMEVSASWNDDKITDTEEYRKYLQVLLQKLEDSPWIERYAIYSHDADWQTRMFYDDGSITPAGEVYRDHRSTFAYNADYTFEPISWSSTELEPFEEGQLANGKVVADSKSDVPGWTCVRSAANGYTKAESGDTYFEVWDSSPNYMSFDYYQNITSLKNGVYRLSAKVFNSSNGVSGASVNGAVGLYAQTIRAIWFAPVTKDSEIESADLLNIGNIVVTDGTLRVGVRNMKPMTARWAGADDFELEYLGTPSEVLGMGGDKAIQAAIADFSGKMTSLEDGTYDLSMLIHNPDGKDASSGWDFSKVEVKSGEAYDGKNTDPKNTYFDTWSLDPYTSTMYQEVRNLPAGEYVLSAIMRSNTTMTMKLSASNGSDTREQTYTGVGATGGLANKGWSVVTLAPVTIANGQSLTIRLECNGTSWWSADHFTLSWRAPGAPTSTVVTLAKELVTFAYDMPLDFSTAIDDLKAYTVSSVTTDKAVLQEVTGAVPSGTGLLLRGEPGATYVIPYAPSEPAAVSNMLKGVLADTKIGGDGLSYVLKDGVFAKAASGTLKAGKAYLKLEAALGRDFLEIGGETTGISAMLNDKGEIINDKFIYNLNGQRISQPMKGLYIKNGKKVVKN